MINILIIVSRFTVKYSFVSLHEKKIKYLTQKVFHIEVFSYACSNNYILNSI